MGDKFSFAEVAILRSHLQSWGLDSFQVAEIVKMFIAEHGYGISSEMAFDAVKRLEGAGPTVESFHRELETLALVM
jgi:hypothetical protein